MSNRKLAQKIYRHLQGKGARLSNGSILFIEEVLDNELKPSKALDGLRTEIIAGKVLVPKNSEDFAWNGASERAVRILDMYKKGEGLFQSG